MEILTPWSSQVHPEAQPKCVQATDRNVDNEFIPGYSKKNKKFWTPAAHVKVTFSLFVERIS